MRIAFICGCLEPGKDGVGDYTRRLAGELSGGANRVMIIALNDRYVAETVFADQLSEGKAIATLRLSSINNFNEAAKEIEKFNPEWISLQFVPYSFQAKGLPYKLSGLLKKLGRNRKWQLMFHELWVGAKPSDYKKRVYAFLQKKIIANLIRSVNPSVIHTHLPQYKEQLEDLSKRKINPLPLFSNISKYNNHSSDTSPVYKLGFFSQADVSERVISFIHELKNNLLVEQKQLEVIFIGGKGNKVQKGAEVLKASAAVELVTSTGFLSDEELSHALQSCQLGITSVPRHALGKSGSAAAFIAHGIPVAAPNAHPGFEDKEIGFLNHDLKNCIVTEPHLNIIAKAAHAAQSAKELISLSAIAETFIKDLEHAITN